ncbi:MAG: T9SS type A sorting domain-containing protein [Cyclobacteriaceae bacterium]|uniref:T9SS type A sorting domain-containing protein n=1 Tax=Nonlabens ulvanivorans TaxID=906888 RepID=UPI003289FAF3
MSRLSKSAFFFVFMICGSLAFSQLRIAPIKSNKKQTQVEFKTLNLPFWDDFSNSENTPDTLLWKVGEDIFVNDALSINTPTYKAASFDGLKGNGIAHDMANDFNANTDSLASHYIDLSGRSAADSIYFSFFWQAGGYAELPDETDLFSLLFYAADSTWQTKWSATGGLSTLSDQFQQEIIAVDSAKYLHDKFRFKFVLNGKSTGPFDSWHLDYIYLNEHRERTDTAHFDRALTGKPTSLFGIYREIPAHVFFKNPMTFLGAQQVGTRNLDNLPHAVRYYYQLENLTTNEVYYDQEISGAAVTLEPAQMDTVFGPTDVTLASQLDPLDSQVISSTFYMFTGDKNLFEEVIGSDTVFQDVDLKVNDTIRQTYTLQNHYAYDDGIAEYAAGINVKNGKIAVQFALAEPDTLTHIDIHFPNIEPDATGESVNLMVWTDLDRNIVLTSQAYTITSNTRLNEFKRIKLDKTQLVRDTIYIGFQQLVEDYVGVGFDKTSPDAKDQIFYNTGDQWIQNQRLDGILMIRPVFHFDSTFILSNNKVLSAPVPYPNPSKGIIHFQKDIDRISIFSLDGSLVFEAGSGRQFDISSLPNQLYLMRIGVGNTTTSSKLILNQ